MTEEAKLPAVTHERAMESLTRLINSHFNNPDQARASIPARPDYDDDLVMIRYVQQQAVRSKPDVTACVSEEMVDLALDAYWTGTGVYAPGELKPNDRVWGDRDKSSMRAAIQAALSAQREQGESRAQIRAEAFEEAAKGVEYQSQFFITEPSMQDVVKFCAHVTRALAQSDATQAAQQNTDGGENDRAPLMGGSGASEDVPLSPPSVPPGEEEVEAVARAICRQEGIDDGYSAKQADHNSNSAMWKSFRQQARAAIASIDQIRGRK